MRASVVDAPGEPEVLHLAEIADPVPAPGQVLVRQTVAGVNYIDTSVRRGRIPHDLPFVPGREGVGTIVALGAGVEGWRAGERVGYSETPHLGGYAELNAVPAGELVRIPDDIDDATACALMLQGITAQYLCADAYAVKPGDTVLVHAAAGGVGALLVQLAKARGATVIATAGGPEKVALARESGADHAIDYRAGDFAPAVREITGGEGVAAVYDAVGADTWERSLASLRRRGVLVLYGASSGRIPPLDIQRLGSGGSLYVTRPTATDFKRTPEELAGRTGELFGRVRDGSLRVRIGARYALGDAARAHRDLEGRATTGKLLLEV
jgi:NADPH2:quinone reductase